MGSELGVSNITITMSDDRLAKLKERAERLGITLDDLIRVSIDELLAQPDEDFERVVEYVLNKNSELYSRLVD